MAGSLKNNGRRELESFSRRVKRQYALDRISKEDYFWLIQKVDDITDFVGAMDEEGGTHAD